MADDPFAPGYVPPNEGRRSRPPLCPCAQTCTPLYNALAFDDRLKTGDLNEGYSGDCIGKSQALEYTVGGQVHVNDMNHCIFTPLKGVLNFKINQGDIEAMVHMGEAVLADVAPLHCAKCGKNRRLARHFYITRNGERFCCECYHKRPQVGRVRVDLVGGYDPDGPPPATRR